MLPSLQLAGLAALLALSPAGAAALGGDRGGPPASPAPVVATDAARATLIERLRASRAKDGPSHEEVVETLHGLGPALLEPLLDLLVARRIPALAEGERIQTLSMPQREMVLATLARWSPSTVLDAMEARLAVSEGERERLAALYVYAAVGQPRHLGRVHELAIAGGTEEAPVTELSDDVATAAQAAFARILRRDPSGYLWLRSEIERAPACLHLPIVFAVGETRDPCGIEVLARVLSFHPELADIVVAQARLLGRSTDEAANRALAGEVRPYLKSERVELACAAARTLGELWDDSSAWELVELLDSGRPAVVDSAHWALKRMSGLDLPKLVGPWRASLSSDAEWWDNEAPGLIETVLHGDVPARLAAISALGNRPWRRADLARDIAPALEAEEELVRLRACASLAQLASPAVAQDLVALLEDDSEAVAKAARGALAAIHGAELPEDPALCRAALHL